MEDLTKTELLSAIILSGLIAKNDKEVTKNTLETAIHIASDLIEMIDGN